jgi:hypothetical protein
MTKRDWKIYITQKINDDTQTQISTYERLQYQNRKKQGRSFHQRARHVSPRRVRSYDPQQRESMIL